MNRTKGLDDLAKRFSEMVRELPNAGHERAMTVTVGGDNFGNINLGSQATLNNFATPPCEETMPQEDDCLPTSVELHSMTREAKRQQRGALIRSFANMPFVLTALIAGTVFALVLSGHFWKLATGDLPWLVPAAIAATFLPASFRAGQIKRREEPLIREARKALEYVRQMKHRQRVMSGQ